MADTTCRSPADSAPPEAGAGAGNTAAPQAWDTAARTAQAIADRYGWDAFGVIRDKETGLPATPPPWWQIGAMRDRIMGGGS